jgi:hypothetical protein
VHVVERDVEELYVPDDVLEEANSASYQMEIGNITSE